MNKKLLVTLGPCGYLRAPGTIGSLVALPAAYYVGFLSDVPHVFCVVLLSITAYYLIVGALPAFARHDHDPRPIIIDEFVGCLWAVWYVDDWRLVMLAFGIFRFLDITKILGIHIVEKLPRPWGILMDDIVAGIYTQVIIRAIRYVWFVY